MGSLRSPWTANRPAIEDHMPKHTTESILPGGGLPTRTPYQFSRYCVTGSTGRAGVVPSYKNKCTTDQRFPQEGAVNNGYQARVDAVISAVLPFLRAPK